MTNQYQPLHPPTRYEIAAWIITGAVLLLLLPLHLLGALLAGLLVHQLTHLLVPLIRRRITDDRAKLVSVGLLSALIVGAVVGGIFGLIAFFRSDAGSLSTLLGKMAEILESSRASLPHWVVEHMPENTDALQKGMVGWLRSHTGELQIFGKEAARGFAHILVGLVIGAMLALYEVQPIAAYRPLARALIERAARLAEAFRRIVFAQMRISAINTAFTALYLAVLLPLFGVHLPLTKTLIAVTFIAGLLPVIGNLISNTVIVVVSLAHSPQTAIASLVFLIVIHKLEYFLNARIVGSQIQARAWELLLAMLAMDAAFGLPGVVAAPIYYAYLKNELSSRGLV
ncbi:MAG: AI-2E family transporter [Sterolibacteriaceae bacterium]|uniref:AI-2E family transporter n=1 Tax=Candidatus Methylophosphatis roskildensis TaxID=2899263 RepID=A0A9D7HW58_9PROT|nr:AI-2E family transporter [Candidatus Methylophosphatis roskildensis]